MSHYLKPSLQLGIALVILTFTSFQGVAHAGNGAKRASFSKPKLHQVALSMSATAYLANDLLEELWDGDEALLCSGSADSCADCCAQLKRKFPGTSCSWRGNAASVDSCEAKLPRVSQR